MKTTSRRDGPCRAGQEPARACIDCDTPWGTLNPGCRKAPRTRGRCNACASKARFHDRRPILHDRGDEAVPRYLPTPFEIRAKAQIARNLAPRRPVDDRFLAVILHRLTGPIEDLQPTA